MSASDASRAADDRPAVVIVVRSYESRNTRLLLLTDVRLQQASRRRRQRAAFCVAPLLQPLGECKASGDFCVFASPPSLVVDTARCRCRRSLSSSSPLLVAAGRRQSRRSTTTRGVRSYTRRPPGARSSASQPVDRSLRRLFLVVVVMRMVTRGRRTGPAIFLRSRCRRPSPPPRRWPCESAPCRSAAACTRARQQAPVDRRIVTGWCGRVVPCFHAT